MGLDVDQLHVDIRRHLGHDFGMAIAGRDREIRRRGAIVHEIAKRRRLLCKHQADARAVRCRLANRRVVQVEDKV